MTLDHLADKTLQERHALKKADEALQNGVITKAEYDFFLKELDITKEPVQDAATAYAEKPTLNEKRRRTGAKAVLAISLIAFIIMSLYIFMPGGGLPGFVTYEPTSEDVILGDSYLSNTNITLNTTNRNNLSVLIVWTSQNRYCHCINYD